MKINRIEYTDIYVDIILKYLTIIVCPGLTTFSSARLCIISLTALSQSEAPAEGSSPPRLPPCLLSSSSSSLSAPVSFWPVEEHTRTKHHCSLLDSFLCSIPMSCEHLISRVVRKLKRIQHSSQLMIKHLLNMGGRLMLFWAHGILTSPDEEVSDAMKPIINCKLHSLAETLMTLRVIFCLCHPSHKKYLKNTLDQQNLCVVPSIRLHSSATRHLCWLQFDYW